MFGGNPGGKEGRVRLGDFWRLVLVRPSEAALERHCRFTIREGRFAGLARRSPMDALGYLQTDIADCVDHGQPDEEQRFQLLAGQVRGQPRRPHSPSAAAAADQAVNGTRAVAVTHDRVVRHVKNSDRDVTHVERNVLCGGHKGDGQKETAGG